MDVDGVGVEGVIVRMGVRCGVVEIGATPDHLSSLDEERDRDKEIERAS